MAEIWKIGKYARYLTPVGGSAKGQWQQFDDADGDLVLTLTEANYLVLCQNSKVMESHSLVNAHTWMRAMTKNDSMLLMYKIKNETRRFRLKFDPRDGKSAEKECSRCAEKLSRFFPIKLSTIDIKPVYHDSKDPSKETPLICTQRSEEQDLLQGEVTIGTMAQLVSGDLNTRIPVAYQQCHMDSPELDILIRLCLTDPSFPEYVQQVDQLLHDVIADCSQ